ncbi:MAG: wax ester/triacylglycerol synthase family O-acyltransferase [Acidimicrobiia bacterium]
MNPLDATFLHVEDSISHMHIASCAVFEGPPPLYPDIVALFRSKLPLVPRYRQRVRFVPGALGRPVWVDDPHFRLDYHVRHTALPPPGSDVDLRNLMGRLMSQPLDRNRPLWETWVVEGLEGDRWALISKIHHCMVDGVSGTDLMTVVLDTSREPTVTAIDTWQPEPEPSDARLVADAILESVVSPYEVARWVRSISRRPRKIASDVSDFVRGASALGGNLRPNSTLSIEGAIGPHRRWTWVEMPLDVVKAARRALGGTINDIVLSAITNGFRELLLSRGEQLDGVVIRSLVPVSVRSSSDRTFNNQVSAMIAELPVGIASPVERLDAMKAQMAGLKESHQAVAANVITNLAGFAPPVLLTLGLRSAATLVRRMPQRSVNTVTTNVPGPQVPLYACGREMLSYYPFVPLSQGVRIGVAILSYNGKIAFGVTGDWDTTPDLDVMAAGIEHGIHELTEAAATAAATSAAAASSAAVTTAARRRSGSKRAAS